MSQATLQKLLALCEMEERYSSLVENRLRSKGIAENPAMVATIAAYYEVLDRLASE
ncbi:MAG: hypothetical protein H0U76_02475 [Ktedonobacteraceae bacterium]|nr:hypothetical protein [Ktedonobacteraceae bacterium]MBA3915921.1 hypothetical protein [Terriglobales bacterium]